MTKRTTIELDQELLRRAQQTLGEPTIRGTVEVALRRAVENIEAAQERRVATQRRYLEALGARADLDVLASEDMWR